MFVLSVGCFGWVSRYSPEYMIDVLRMSNNLQIRDAALRIAIIVFSLRRLCVRTRSCAWGLRNWLRWGQSGVVVKQSGPQRRRRDERSERSTRRDAAKPHLIDASLNRGNQARWTRLVAT